MELNSDESISVNKPSKTSNRLFHKRLSQSLEKEVPKLPEDWKPLHATPDSHLSETTTNNTNPNPPPPATDTLPNNTSLTHLEPSSILGLNDTSTNNKSDVITANPTTTTAPSSDPSQAHLFIEEAIRELLKARRILRCSYVYGYYLDTFGHKKFIFEFVQTEFEECTENLSQIIARPHLKTPKPKIIRLTNLLKRKRIEFIETITRGLNSFNDTPPTLKKYSRQRWKYLLKDNIQNDDEFKNTIALSLKELNPKNPWIIDRKVLNTELLKIIYKLLNKKFFTIKLFYKTI